MVVVVVVVLVVLDVVVLLDVVAIGTDVVVEVLDVVEFGTDELVDDVDVDTSVVVVAVWATPSASRPISNPATTAHPNAPTPQHF